MQKLGRHIQHYFPLFAIFIVGIFGVIWFPYDSSFQLAVTIAIACGYVSWGVVHHYIHGDLEAYVVAEYATVAFIGVVIIFSLLYL
jgi:hypothetical protein